MHKKYLIHKLLGTPEFQNDEKLKTATSQKELLWLNA